MAASITRMSEHRVATRSSDPSCALASYLAQHAVITEDDVLSATEHAARTGVSLVESIVASGLLAETAAYRALAEAIGKPFADLAAQAPTPMALKLVPERVARRHHVVPLSEDNRTLTYASCIGVHDEAERDLAFASGRRPVVVIATKTQVMAALAAAYAQANDVEELIKRIHHAGAVKSGDIENTDRRSDSPVVDLCNRILAAAINAGASDIHLEPGSDGAVIRHRVCGILEPLLVLPGAALGAVTNRFKILAGTDITTRRKPQDGAFRVSIEGRPIDVRLSALPTTHGEKLVMRVIDSGTSFQTFNELGYNADASAQIRAALSKPDGLVLMTGPTGSGKTTALYAALHFLRTGRVNIVTVEDPVERHLEGVSQIPVNSRSGNSFASVLRSVMRQDPNVIMVGEIRDNEVADIVGQAAFTGHLVLSSLHTSDAASAITRMLNLGLAPFKVAESLNAVVAQRLVRKLCVHCRTMNDEHAAKRLGALAGLARLAASPGKGCDRCKQTGYLGRVAVPEVLIPDEVLRSAIRDGAGAREIRAAMRAAGCPSMRQTALALAMAGVTSIEEIDRVLSNHDEEAPATPVVRDKVRVLVTDDDRMIRMLVRLLLEKDGYEVIEAENGTKGLEMARRERPDLILVDLMMPDMDGFEMLDRVRHDLTLSAVPVMVLTAETGSSVEQRALELGADDYLVKPFEADVLLSRVRAVFRRVSRTAAA